MSRDFSLSLLRASVGAEWRSAWRLWGRHNLHEPLPPRQRRGKRSTAKFSSSRCHKTPAGRPVDGSLQQCQTACSRKRLTVCRGHGKTAGPSLTRGQRAAMCQGIGGSQLQDSLLGPLTHTLGRGHMRTLMKTDVHLVFKRAPKVSLKLRSCLS